MHPIESKVLPQSDYYIYTPSAIARQLYFYPLIIGYYRYQPGYFIERSNFDNFLIMYITSGSCTVRQNNSSCTVNKGQFLLLDCYKPHRYGSETSWEAVWLHFDGPLAREYYRMIHSACGGTISSPHSHRLGSQLTQLCDCFRKGSPVIESVMSEAITRLLNGLLATSHTAKESQTSSIATAVAYINEHYQQDISLEELAKKAGLSLYHFTRVFSNETNVTPHRYIMLTRLSAAKFLLRSSEASVKDITFNCGFHSESAFCSTFRKLEGCTPSQYRQKISTIK